MKKLVRVFVIILFCILINFLIINMVSANDTNLPKKQIKDNFKITQTEKVKIDPVSGKDYLETRTKIFEKPITDKASVYVGGESKTYREQDKDTKDESYYGVGIEF